MSSSQFTLPSTMRFIAIQSPGAPEVMQIAEGPLPIPRTGEVLIKVSAAGVNRADLGQREGHYPPPADASPIMGLEAAGTIVALGTDVSQRQLGDQVCVLTHGGAYAEYVTAPAVLCFDLPSGFSMEQAAALPEAAMTVWSNIFMSGKLNTNETLLVHGGTSGIGSCAIQYALAFGCKVIATAGSERKCQAILDLGANLAINYKQTDFVAEALKFTGGHGVNLILDIIGGDYTARNISMLALDGRIAQVSWQQSSKVTIDLSELSRRRAILTGTLLRPRSLAQKQFIVEQLKQHVWPFYNNGRIKPIIDQVYPLEQVVQAHRDMAASGHIGKLILSLS